MGIEAIIALVMALISYFTAKKTGASDSVALGAAAVAGLGTYYVATETDWGKGVINDLNTAWNRAFGTDGEPLTDELGRDVYGPAGSQFQTKVVADGEGGSKTVAVVDALGRVVGSIGGQAIKTTGETLQSWGPAGTIAVGAAATALSSASTNRWLVIGGVGLAALLLLRS